jgi:hypothetical protein
LVDHDGEGEAGMVFCFGLDQLRRLIDRIIRPVPVNDQAIDASADHVFDLPFHLRRIGRTVADIHVMPGAEPGLHMHVYLGRSSGIQQRVHVNLADISGTLVSVRLTDKGIGGAGVVRSLGSQGGGWNYVSASRTYRGYSEQQRYNQNLQTHFTLGRGGIPTLHTEHLPERGSRPPVIELV